MGFSLSNAACNVHALIGQYGSCDVWPLCHHCKHVWCTLIEVHCFIIKYGYGFFWLSLLTTKDAAPQKCSVNFVNLAEY